MTVGIDKLRVYPSTLSLDLEALCEARGRDPRETIAHLFVDERSVMPPWEDSVSMAVNAAAPLLDDADRASVELLVVGTETPVDLEKPISSWVHRLLELPSRCRNFEIKHACYSVTAGMQLALAWLASPAGAGKKALVVGADASLLGIDEPYEYVLGAGAVALLLGHEPGFLEIAPGASGVYAAEVTDVIRPTRRIETGSSEESLFAYLEAVNGAFDDYAPRGPAFADLAHVVYHAPFGGITFRAHQALLRRDADVRRAEAWADFERRSLPGLVHHRRTGGVYGGSTFVSLLGAVDARPELGPGDPIGVFSFGSGSCAEFYAARLGPAARRVATQAQLALALDAREAVSVAQYEGLERERDRAAELPDFEPMVDAWAAHHESCWAGRGRCLLRRVSSWKREYAWS